MDNENTTNNHDLVVLSKAVLDNLKNNFKKRVVLISLIPAALVGILAINYYYQYQVLKNNPQKAAQQETQDLVAAVSRLMVLPNEDPTIATVADPDKLKDQAFFANSKKGDKVLIYPNARKAVLYSPETNKIIDVAPLVIGNPSAIPTSVKK